MDKIKPFEYWVQKTLPAVYDDSLSYYQLLAKIVHHLNTIGDSQNVVIDKVKELMNWFDNLDVQDEVNTKLDEMAQDGTLDQIINHNIFNDLNTRLEQTESIQVSVLKSGAKLDGINDDLPLLQQFTDSLPEGTKVIFPPNRVFNISEPWRINKSLKIDFNNSKLRYIGTKNLGVDNGINRTHAAIMVEGSLDTSKQVNVIGFVPNYRTTQNVTTDQPFRTRNISKIITDSTHLSQIFSVGDIVKVMVSTIVGGWSKTYEDNPARVICSAKIIAIDGSDILVDINPNFSFTGSVHGTVTKINPINDLVLENLYYEDATTDNIPQYPTHSDRETWVGAIRLNYTNNAIINNVECKGHKFPAISGILNYNTSIINARGYEPKAISDGCGYLIQLIQSTYASVDKLRGSGNRHLIDFSGGGHHVVNDAKQSGSPRSTEFDCHGEGEFDVTFRDCRGGIQLGNGIESFPAMITDIQLENVHGLLQMFTWVKSVNVVNSKINLLEAGGYQGVVDFKATNSEIRGLETNNFIRAYSRGKIYNNSKFQLINCEIVIYDIVRYETDYFMTLTGFETVKFKNTRIVNLRNKDLRILLEKCKYVYIDDEVIENTGFDFKNTSSLTDLQLSNKATMNRGMIQVNGMVLNKTKSNEQLPFFGFLKFFDLTGVSNLKIIFNGNQVDANSTETTDARWVGFYDTSSITGNIFLTVTNNTFLKNILDVIPTEITSLKIKMSNNNLEGYTGSTISE